VTPLLAPGVHLLAPGLFQPQPDGWPQPPRLPALEGVLARGAWQSLGAAGTDATLLALFGVLPRADAPPPIAALSHLAEFGGTLNERLLLAAPVHLHPDRDKLRLFAGEVLAIDEAESRRLLAEFNAHFADRGLRLEWAAADRWYLHAPTPPAIQAVPLADALGHSVQEHLPTGPEARFWHGVLNETQMLFHLSEVNRQREGRGALPLNSLWLWGSGQAIKVPARPFAALYADDLPSRGLARLADTPCFGLAALAPRTSLPPGALLVVDSAPGEALARQQPGPWLDALKGLEQRLGDLLALRPAVPLWLYGGDGRRCQLSPLARYRLWRTRRPWGKAASSA